MSVKPNEPGGRPITETAVVVSYISLLTGEPGRTVSADDPGIADPLAVGQVAQQEVVRQLCSRAAGERIHRFELKQPAVRDQHVQKVRLAKRSKRAFDRLLPSSFK